MSTLKLLTPVPNKDNLPTGAEDAKFAILIEDLSFHELQGLAGMIATIAKTPPTAPEHESPISSALYHASIEWHKYFQSLGLIK